MDESFSDFQFPVHGIDRTRSNQEQPAGSTILGQNCRAFEASTLRGRGGSRPGILPYVNDVLPGEVQNLTSVVTVDGTALLANYDDTPPDLYDPSSVGPVDAWPPGRFTRSPALGLPEWGWGIPPWKNAPETVNIVWPSPSLISVGTALSAAQLNAVARDRITDDVVSGTFTYEPKSGTLLPPGQGQELLARFVPDDSTRYGVTYGFNAIDVGYASASVELTITANSFTLAEGEVYEFDGTEFSAEGLVDGDTITSCTIASIGADGLATDGPYTIFIEDAIFDPEGAEDKYDIEYENGVLTVYDPESGGGTHVGQLYFNNPPSAEIPAFVIFPPDSTSTPFSSMEEWSNGPGGGSNMNDLLSGEAVIAGGTLSEPDTTVSGPRGIFFP